MKTTIFHKLLPALILLAGLSACQDDESEFRPSVGDGDGLTLEFVSDPMQKISVTRASDPKDDEEKRMNTLYVFFFDSNGNPLEGKVQAGEASPYSGYAELDHETVLKIDKNALAGNPEASDVTVYAVANLSALEANEYFGEREEVSAGSGLFRRSKVTSLGYLESIVYRLDEISVGLPGGVMPMVGKLTGVNLVDESANHAEVEMYALMARVDVSLKIDSDEGDNNLPRLFIAGYDVVNAPKRVSFGDPLSYSSDRLTGMLGEDKATISVSNLNQTIYNRNGEISFSFYMFENIQQKLQDPAWPDGVTLDATGYPSGVYDPAHGIDKRQNYKPYFADEDNAANIVLHTYYTDYNGKTTEVDYTLYLGANHTDDFRVKRNHQYKNDITIKGLTEVGNNPSHITFDARVNIYEESNNNYYLAILRERNHDAHFCVTPMDVYMFGDSNGYSVSDPTTDPSIEVILGDCGDSGETPANVPDWIAMELIPAANMERGDVPSTTVETGNALLPTNEPWHAGNGKRSWFTTSLITELNRYNGGHVTVSNSRDRIYFYIDENLTLEDRTATVTVIYKEGGTEVSRSTMELGQVHLLSVTCSNGEVIYMEQIEEYLEHYDPLDEHSTTQIYDGLPWAVRGSGMENQDIEDLRDGALSFYENPKDIYYDGWEYTGFVVNTYGGQRSMTLNGVPLTAFQYCHNKNKRNLSGLVPASYTYINLLVDSYYRRDSDSGKWFLPGITQMENALETYHRTYPVEFQDYYWSASAAKEGRNGNNQDGDRARATRVDSNGNHIESNEEQANWYPNGGNALRTEELRIRAFRVDLQPYDY